MSESKNILETKKRLAACFVSFLSDELKNDQLSIEDKESLEIAMQCIGNVYGIQENDFTLPDILSVFTNQEIKDEKEINQKPISEEDKKKANELKVQGNELMNSGKIKEGLENYTKAIELDSSNAIYYCNRAAAYSKLEMYSASLEDCKRAVRIDPKYSKAYSRMGHAFVNMNDYQRAHDAYKKAFELEPNETNESNLQLCEKKMAEANQKKQSSNPLCAGFGGLDSMLNNPNFLDMAQQMMSNVNMQNMVSQLMGSLMGGQPGAAPPNPSDGQTNESSTNQTNPNEASQETNSENPNPADPAATLLNVGYQFAERIREMNPELVDQLRAQLGKGPSDNQKDEGEK